MIAPQDIQLIGNEVAIRWADGAESYITVPALRAASPSAESKGERDIFGNLYGGETKRSFDNVSLVDWERIGGYAIRFHFSDGHNSGLYSYDYLRSVTGANPPH